jgi:hypothetical protein
VFMVSADDGWAVGKCPRLVPTRDIHENIIHWNGTCWNRVASPVVCMLYSVFMVSADDGWAVGMSWIIEEGRESGGPGVIIRWNGTSWNNVTSPTNSRLNSVFMVSADDGWAVGYNGAIIRWNGTSWNNVTSPTTSLLYSVFMVSADDGWAVGDPGVIIRWNGTSWNNVTSPTTSLLSSVFMVGPDDGWAVGYKNASPVAMISWPGVIIHWDGTSWNTVTRNPEPLALMSVVMVGPDDGWAVGVTGTIQRWTGTEWIPEFSAVTFMLVLINFTLVAVIVKKTALRKSRRPQLPSENQI